MDLETSINVLSLMSQALNEPQSQEQALDHLTEITGTLMGTEQTAILLRDEDRGTFVVKTNHGFHSDGIKVGHPLRIPERLHRILWRMRIVRQIGYIEAGLEGLAFPMLVIPLRVKGERIGLLVTCKPASESKDNTGGARFSPMKRHLLQLIASFASLVIENARANAYLQQHFARHSQEITAMAQEGGEETDQQTNRLIVTSVKNPHKVARLLAESFYKELARAGFSTNEITTASAHILTCLTGNQYESSQPDRRQQPSEDEAG